MYLLNKLLYFVVNLLGSQMRAPGVGWAGRWAMFIMERGNPPSIRMGIQRLHLQPTDTYVEIGAGHGVGLRAVVTGHSAGQQQQQGPPARVVAVEVSPVFYKRLQDVKRELEESNTNSNTSNVASTCTPIELYNQDAKDMKAFLLDESVDKIFAMNVVYFLDPLEEYLAEILRVLKPGGSVTFGFKTVTGFKPPFINTAVEPIVDKMRRAGFTQVTSEPIDLGNPLFNYVEIKGLK